MDEPALSEEAQGLAKAMHETGMVFPYHPMLLRHNSKQRQTAWRSLTSVRQICFTVMRFSSLFAGVGRHSGGPRNRRYTRGRARPNQLGGEL
jgi:hypothetical protein